MHGRVWGLLIFTLTMYRKNSGFSLIELLLVLGIIAALSTAAFIIFPKVQAANERQRNQQDVDVPIVHTEEDDNEQHGRREGRFHSEFDNGF